MQPRHSKLSFALLLVCCLQLIGCNAFEGLDRSINNSDFSARLYEANLALAEADYKNALDLFNRIAEENGTNDDVLRGRASAKAGLAGFNMFSVLNSLQNDVVTPDTRYVFFSAARQITDSTLLHEAMQDMGKLTTIENTDRIFRSLMACLYMAKSLVSKYDTNLSGKLDTPDQINFSTNDSKTATWSKLFADATADSSIYSLEKSFIELTQAFNGRGSEWVMISPVKGVSFTGTYTPANRKTILAITSFVEGLQAANLRFNVSESAFKEAVMLLDGA